IGAVVVENPPALVIDLSAVEFLGSVGLKILAATYEKLGKDTGFGVVAPGAAGAMITAMDVDHPHDDQRWDRRERGETEVQRLDRNWNSLLQELRVVQTGVQLLTGFLLTLPFQQRFDVLGHRMRDVYLATVSCSVG